MSRTDETMDVSAYLSDRVEDQLEYYGNAADRAKRVHMLVQTTIIVLGLLVPVLANLPETVGSIDVSNVIKFAVTLSALALAILTGISNFRKFGDLWLSYRTTAELIKHEKYLFLTKSGQYASKDSAFDRFVSAIESIVSSEHNKFRSLIEEAQRPVTPNRNE